MPFLIIGLAILICFIAVLMYFFSIAFVKHNVGNVDDIEAEVNKSLEKYKERIKAGIEYIENKPHKWVSVISNDGLKLAARYFDNGYSRTVILFHGYRSAAARDFSCAVEMYTKLGFNVLLCDQRSHGRSEGKLITFGVKESMDVLSWVEFVELQYAPEKIVLGGMSMGATTVLLSLKYSLPETVKGVVADCGFTSPAEIIKKVAKDSFSINATLFMPFMDICCRLIGGFSILKDNTVETVKNSDIPVMLIHGAGDDFVPCDMSKQTFESVGERGRLLIIDKAGHGLSFLVDEEKVVTEIKKFLEKYV